MTINRLAASARESLILGGLYHTPPGRRRFFCFLRNYSEWGRPLNAWEFFKQGAVEPGGTAADDTVVRGEPRVDFLDLQQGFPGFVPIDIAAGQMAFQSRVASNAFSTKGK